MCACVVGCRRRPDCVEDLVHKHNYEHHLTPFFLRVVSLQMPLVLIEGVICCRFERAAALFFLVQVAT